MRTDTLPHEAIAGEGAATAAAVAAKPLQGAATAAAVAAKPLQGAAKKRMPDTLICDVASHGPQRLRTDTFEGAPTSAAVAAIPL